MPVKTSTDRMLRNWNSSNFDCAYWIAISLFGVVTKRHLICSANAIQHSCCRQKPNSCRRSATTFLFLTARMGGQCDVTRPPFIAAIVMILSMNSKKTWPYECRCCVRICSFLDSGFSPKYWQRCQCVLTITIMLSVSISTRNSYSLSIYCSRLRPVILVPNA